MNTRSLTIEEVRAEREAAFDFYVAVRAAYTQYREHRVYDRSEVPEESSWIGGVSSEMQARLS